MISKRLNLTLLALLLAGSAHAEPSKTSASAGKAVDASRCMACHQGGLSLTRYSGDELTQRILALRHNPANHPPLMLEDADEDAIQKLASALSSGQAE